MRQLTFGFFSDFSRYFLLMTLTWLWLTLYIECLSTLKCKKINLPPYVNNIVKINILYFCRNRRGPWAGLGPVLSPSWTPAQHLCRLSRRIYFQHYNATLSKSSHCHSDSNDAETLKSYGGIDILSLCPHIRSELASHLSSIKSPYRQCVRCDSHTYTIDPEHTSGFLDHIIQFPTKIKIHDSY